MQVKVGRRVAERTGEVPKLRDIGKELGYIKNPTTCIAFYWGYDNRKPKEERITQREAIDNFYRAIGFPKGRLRGRDPLVVLVKRKPNSMGFRLTQSRLENGLTKEEVSIGTGLGRSTITRHETGKAYPTVGSLMGYSSLYGKSLQYFVTGED